MKRRYPARSTRSSRAAAGGRVLASRCALLVTAAPYLAAEAVLRLPGRVRRLDPPGVRSRPGDWRAPPTGYLQEAVPGTGGPHARAPPPPFFAPPPPPPPASPRTPLAPAHPPPGRT